MNYCHLNVGDFLHHIIRYYINILSLFTQFYHCLLSFSDYCNLRLLLFRLFHYHNLLLLSLFSLIIVNNYDRVVCFLFIYSNSSILLSSNTNTILIFLLLLLFKLDLFSIIFSTSLIYQYYCHYLIN